ncbi:MAG: hypothetical protein VX733_02100 [Candidatus Latescibacterota bacterium]|nr:hypothetical protein [Candidatus Latescibacterota bacterium]
MQDPTLAEAHRFSFQLRRELDLWLEHSSCVDGPQRNQGGEDEANYALAWFPHYLLTGNPMVLTHFQSLLADLSGWVQSDECFHGYERKAEVHHGTEPFLLFLPRYLGLAPDDEMAWKLLEDVAHHVGNWVADVPEWYDFERDVFRSYLIGAVRVSDDPAYAYELAEHFRFLHISLAAFRVTGDERYRDWALRYGRQRAERISLTFADGVMPLMWDLAGSPVHWPDVQTKEQRVMAATIHKVEGDTLGGHENLLASGALMALADLHELSEGEGIFQEAAHLIAEPLVSQLNDPFADPAATAITHYRARFDDDSFDRDIAQVLAGAPAESDTEWAMILPQSRSRREPGVGKRMDMVYWGEWEENGSTRPLREPSTAALALGYQVTGDVDLACRALRGAVTKLAMARVVLRGGREHSDMGGAICSVAAGHGRNWGTGAVTGCYGPLHLGTLDCFGEVRGVVRFLSDGREALPEGALSLVRPAVGDSPGELLLHNGRRKQLSFSCRREDWRQGEELGEWQTVTIQPDTTTILEL